MEYSPKGMIYEGVSYISKKVYRTLSFVLVFVQVNSPLQHCANECTKDLAYMRNLIEIQVWKAIQVYAFVFYKVIAHIFVLVEIYILRIWMICSYRLIMFSLTKKMSWTECSKGWKIKKYISTQCLENLSHCVKYFVFYKTTPRGIGR